MRLLVISPHLDDAVLSCGNLLAANPGTFVVTVMAGRPDPYPSPLPMWDRLCGFEDGVDVVSLRRGEDREALGLLGAEPIWLPFLDEQYTPGNRPSIPEIAAAIQRATDESGCDTVISPMGIQHPDHILTGVASLQAATLRPNVEWLLYEETPYRQMYARQEAIDRVTAAGFGLHTAPALAVDTAGSQKREAIQQYRSQVAGLGKHGLLDDAYEPDRFWRLRRPLA